MYFNPCKVPTGFQLGIGFLTPCGETDNYAVDCGSDLQYLCMCMCVCVVQGDLTQPMIFFFIFLSCLQC